MRLRVGRTQAASQEELGFGLGVRQSPEPMPSTPVLHSPDLIYQVPEPSSTEQGECQAPPPTS